MCGIAGIYRFDGGQVDPYEIDILTDAVAHRGPDGRGTWFNHERSLALGHRRLSILDLTDAGRQPMSYNGRYWITLNGEIYNFIEIKKELIRKGHVFSSQTDTEVVLAAYKEWGTEMLPRLNGMWALALYDDHEKKLLLSRDRFGVKPLYYYLDGQKLIFSSEVQAIHSLLGPKHPLNRTVIELIAQGHFTNHGTRETYLNDVFSVPGGYNILIKNDKLEELEWYSLKRTSVPADFKEQASALKRLIHDACRLRLRSDVPIGTCLSGGLDSSIITAVINNKKNHEHNDRSSNYTHRSFCAAFPNTPIDESESAQKISHLLEVRLDIVPVDPPTRSELEETLKSCDGPMHSLAFYPIWVLYKYIKRAGITVTLDGQGPDEMLGGYFVLYEGLVTAAKRGNIRWFLDLYRTYSNQGESQQWSSRNAAKQTMKLFMKNSLTALKKHILGREREPNNRMPVSHPAIKKMLKAVRPEQSMSNPLDRSLFRQFFQAPLPGILNQYDRCSMANGVECRMPFMDYRIVEFIFSLPPESKIGHGYTKQILRESMKGILPDSARLNKLKIGFNAPIVDWFRGPLREFMLEQMNKKKFLDSPYFDGEKIRNEFDIFLNKPNPQFKEAWKFWPPVHLVWWIDYRKIEA